MTRVLNRVSDRILSRFVPKAEAGACVPENGSTYTAACGSCSCKPNERWIKKTCTYRIGCTGSSTLVSYTCTTTQNIC